MPDKSTNSITTPKSGFFQDIAMRVRLILRLMRDRRVNPLLKLVPVASLVYLIFPDLLPGPIDDALIIWLSTYLFVELCPPEVVQEHLEALNRTIDARPKDVPIPPKAENIIEGEFTDIDPNKPSDP
jgi:hypothetical protein